MRSCSCPTGNFGAYKHNHVADVPSLSRGVFVFLAVESLQDLLGRNHGICHQVLHHLVGAFLFTWCFFCETAVHVRCSIEMLNKNEKGKSISEIKFKQPGWVIGPYKILQHSIDYRDNGLNLEVWQLKVHLNGCVYCIFLLPAFFDFRGMRGQIFSHVRAWARQDMAVDLHDFGLWCPDDAWLIFICGIYWLSAAAYIRNHSKVWQRCFQRRNSIWNLMYLIDTRTCMWA